MLMAAQGVSGVCGMRGGWGVSREGVNAATKV